MSQIPKPYEVYRHFKGSLYQVLSVAEHSETGEKLVVYQAMYGEFKIYARPLCSFVEKLDKSEYPEAVQTYRFEVWKTESSRRSEEAKESELLKDACDKERKEAEELNIDPMVMQFLEAETYEERLNILAGLKRRITDGMITTMAIACDVEVPEGNLEERYQGLKACLLTRDRFECNRLR